MKRQRHQRKEYANDAGVSDACRTDDGCVPLMVDTQGLKGAAESVQQVPEQREYTGQIKKHQPDIAEFFLHLDIEVVRGIVVGIEGDLGTHKKIGDMYGKKNQQEGTQHAHAPAVPAAILLRIGHGVFYGAGTPVLAPEQKALDDMEQQSGEEPDFHEADDPVVAHEVGGLVEGCTVVVEKDAGIDSGMYNQKTDEEKSGEAHQEFLAYR